MTRAAGLLAAALGPGCGCNLEGTEEDLAGEDAKDCGLADGERLESAWQCAIEQFRNEEAFRVSWFGDSIDTVDEHSFASNGRDVWLLELDDYRGPSEIYGWDCLSPFVATMAQDEYFPERPFGYEYIDCGSLEPAGNHYQVCGNPGDSSHETIPFDP